MAILDSLKGVQNTDKREYELIQLGQFHFYNFIYIEVENTTETSCISGIITFLTLTLPYISADQTVDDWLTKVRKKWERDEAADAYGIFDQYILPNTIC